jgi:hypothetical protein
MRPPPRISSNGSPTIFLSRGGQIGSGLAFVPTVSAFDAFTFRICDCGLIRDVRRKIGWILSSGKGEACSRYPEDPKESMKVADAVCRVRREQTVPDRSL